MKRLKIFHPLSFLAIAAVFALFYLAVYACGAGEHIVIVSLTPMEDGSEPNAFVAMLFIFAHNFFYIAAPVLVIASAIFALARPLYKEKSELTEKLPPIHYPVPSGGK